MEEQVPSEEYYDGVCLWSQQSKEKEKTVKESEAECKE